MPSELEKKLDEVLDSNEATRAEAQMLRHEVRVLDDRKTILAIIALQSFAILIMFGILISIAISNHHEAVTIQQCTTAGHIKPTPANHFTTGHACFDASQAQTRDAVGNIVDTNHNGIPDNVEILNKLEGAKP